MQQFVKCNLNVKFHQWNFIQHYICTLNRLTNKTNDFIFKNQISTKTNNQRIDCILSHYVLKTKFMNIKLTQRSPMMEKNWTLQS